MWLSTLITDLQSKGSPVWFPVRAHAWVAGQVPNSGHVRGNNTLMFLSLFLSSFPSVWKEIDNFFKKKNHHYDINLTIYLNLKLTMNALLLTEYNTKSQSGGNKKLSPELKDSSFLSSHEVLFQFISVFNGDKEKYFFKNFLLSNLWQFHWCLLFTFSKQL